MTAVYLCFVVLHSIRENDLQEEESELVTPGGIFSNTHQTEYSVDELMSSESKSMYTYILDMQRLPICLCACRLSMDFYILCFVAFPEL